jgi:hypothetical protein
MFKRNNERMNKEMKYRKQDWVERKSGESGRKEVKEKGKMN